MQQVLGNLVTNALHHTAADERITLGAEADRGRVRIRVEDTGAGIPEQDQPLIFDRFWRGDRSRSRSGATGGGLGLAIARQLVQANGGGSRPAPRWVAAPRSPSRCRRQGRRS
jgi:signal transduction histidine kinase